MKGKARNRPWASRDWSRLEEALFDPDHPLSVALFALAERHTEVRQRAKLAVRAPRRRLAKAR